MQGRAKWQAGWYRSIAWKRYWFFSAGVILAGTTFISMVYVEPHSVAAKVGFGAAFALSYGVLSMSWMLREK